MPETEDLHRDAVSRDDPDAMYQLGNLAWEAGNVAEAVRWWEVAAEYDHTTAILALGYLCKKRGDEDAWWKAVKKASRLGDSDAMRLRGLHAQWNDNREKAQRWYEKSANLGNVQAMRHHAELSEDEGNSKEARMWREKAEKVGRTPQPGTPRPVEALQAPARSSSWKQTHD
jgi:TPR repeat protein